MFHSYLLWLASTHWLGALDHTMALSRWPNHVLTGTTQLQWEESIRWMPHPPSAHRRSLCPTANYILVNRTFNLYASNPDGPIQTPSILPALASIQTQVQGPYSHWMSSPFQSLRELEHCSRWASFLLRLVAFQNPYPTHNTALPLSVVAHTIAHILHCDNSSGFYQGYLDQMELSFMLTLLLCLAQTDSTHLWGLTSPAIPNQGTPPGCSGQLHSPF
jgi:hypothetical protein